MKLGADEYLDLVDGVIGERDVLLVFEFLLDLLLRPHANLLLHLENVIALQLHSLFDDHIDQVLLPDLHVLVGARSLGGGDHELLILFREDGPELLGQELHRVTGFVELPLQDPVDAQFQLCHI